MKAIGVNAISDAKGSGTLYLLTPVEGWNGGGLPGNEYMSSKGSATFRVTAQNKPVDCTSIGPHAAMAPAKVKNLKVMTPPAIAKIGKSEYVASVGACEGEGPDGPTEVHFAEVEMQEPDGIVWHTVLLISYPKSAPPELKMEAAAWGRAAEFKGKNARKP